MAYATDYIFPMPTALRDMQPWRRTLVEHGLTYRWLAERTDRSRQTVAAYADGRRRPPEAWLANVAEVLAKVERGEAA